MNFQWLPHKCANKPEPRLWGLLIIWQWFVLMFCVLVTHMSKNLMIPGHGPFAFANAAFATFLFLLSNSFHKTRSIQARHCSGFWPGNEPGLQDVQAVDEGLLPFPLSGHSHWKCGPPQIQQEPAILGPSGPRAPFLPLPLLLPLSSRGITFLASSSFSSPSSRSRLGARAPNHGSQYA